MTPSPNPTLRRCPWRRCTRSGRSTLRRARRRASSNGDNTPRNGRSCTTCRRAPPSISSSFRATWCDARTPAATVPGTSTWPSRLLPRPLATSSPPPPPCLRQIELLSNREKLIAEQKMFVQYLEMTPKIDREKAKYEMGSVRALPCMHWSTDPMDSLFCARFVLWDDSLGLPAVDCRLLRRRRIRRLGPKLSIL
jgi:hypothetical protein